MCLCFSFICLMTVEEISVYRQMQICMDEKKSKAFKKQARKKACMYEVNGSLVRFMSDMGRTFKTVYPSLAMPSCKVLFPQPICKTSFFLVSKVLSSTRQAVNP